MPHGRSSILFFVCVGGALAAQPAETPATPAPTPPRAEPAIPSLDELLGLEETGGTADRTALDRQLSAREAGEQFQQAVGLMGDAAGRIAGSGDTGIETQRLQEDVLRKLDQVIEAAKQNQSGGGGQSRSPSQGQQSGQQPDQPTQNQQQAGRPGSESGQEQMAPALSGVEMNPGLVPDGVTWGNLPERAREAVSQGVSDRYSAMYRRMTELYYRKLAEQESDE